jgi:hypothetical protein
MRDFGNANWVLVLRKKEKKYITCNDPNWIYYKNNWINCKKKEEQIEIWVKSYLLNKKRYRMRK